MFIFYLISFHYIRSDYVSIDLIRFDLPDFWLGVRAYILNDSVWLYVQMVCAYMVCVQMASSLSNSIRLS